MDSTTTKSFTKGRQVVGEVISTKMNRTVTIAVTRTHKHPLYKKIVRKTVRFAAHNTIPDIAVGDKVIVSEVRPVSKRVHYRVVEKV